MKNVLVQMKTLAGMSLLAASVNAHADQSGPIPVADSGSTDSGFPFQVVSKEDLLERYIVTFQETGTSTDNLLVQGPSSAATTGFEETDAPSVGFENRVVVAGNFIPENAENLLTQLGATPEKVIPEFKMVAARMTKAAYNRLRSNGQVANISIDPKRYPLAQNTPYGYTMVQANQLSQNNLSARKVCVIDTGYNLNHPDLPDANNGATGVANNNSVGNWYNDGNGHGTHVAGTIAALDNSEGVIGVYPGVNVHTVKIFNDQGNWTFASDLIAGIQQCKDAGANVVNMSLGGGSSSTSESNSMQSFVNDGLLLVAAAGNDGNSSFSYPASYDAVVSVGAVSSSESHASYSQYNSQVELSAPGSSVYSTYPNNTYATLSGTSMASPHVAGAAALVWSFFPQCSNEQIRSALNATAKDKGASGRDNFYGHGIVQAKDAYNYLNTHGCAGNGGGGGGGGGDVETLSTARSPG